MGRDVAKGGTEAMSPPLNIKIASILDVSETEAVNT